MAEAGSLEVEGRVDPVDKPTPGSDEKMMTDEEKMAGCGVCMFTPDKKGLLGNYDYAFLCRPTMPWNKEGVEPPVFLAKDEKIGLFLALMMGLQHTLAMVAGIATAGGSLIAGDACFPWQADPELCSRKPYLINAAWTTSGFLTIIQVFRARIGRSKYYLGTGLISVMGTSFTFLPIAREMVVGEIMNSKNACAAVENPGLVGYGKFLGTCMVASLLECCIGMLPAKVLKKLFPPIVTGTAMMLIGGGLIGAGVKYLGGGVFCGENDLTRVPRFGGPQLCNENGAVTLPFGDKAYIGLGSSVIICSIFIQIFGSPFLKSTFLFWSLVFGCIVSGGAGYVAKPNDKVMCAAEPDNACIGGFANAEVGKRYSFWDWDAVVEAPWFTFNWLHTFPLGFAPEYLFPLLIGYFVSAAETVGDISMSCAASQIPVEGDDFNSRVQGGLLADGVNSFLACLMTSPPNTTFSQNNGIIALTRCASRAAGFACAFWLILFGILGKLGAVFASIPICVLGGEVLQCFTMVFVSGMQMATKNKSRRNSFILVISLSFGLGVAMMPNLFEGGGSKGFYAANLKFNSGFWPEKYTCDEFYTVNTVATGAKCDVPGGSVIECDGGAGGPTREFAQPYRSSLTSIDVSWSDCENICNAIPGATFTPAVMGEMTFSTDQGEQCRDKGGYCCKCFNQGQRSLRTAIIMILKTPYCIGFLIAVFMNLTIPEDKDEKHHAEKTPHGENEFMTDGHM